MGQAAPAIEMIGFITSFKLGSNVLAIFQCGRKNTKTLGSEVIGILVLLHTGSVTLGSYSIFWSPTLLTCAMRTLIETLDEQTIAQGHVKGSAVCQVHNSCLINGSHIVVC